MIANEFWRRSKAFLGATTGWKGPVLPENELECLTLYYRPIEHRGFDQWHCWKAKRKQKKKTGRDDNFCQSCPHWVPMSSLDNNLGKSEDCGKGHYRFEAT